MEDSRLRSDLHGANPPSPPAPDSRPAVAGLRHSAPAFGAAAAGWQAGRRFPPRQSFAAIDLGTNNCRLLIARPVDDGFAVIDAFSRIVRLGEGLGDSGRISDAAMDRAVDALAVCADKLRRRHVVLSRAVATEACRRATNGAEFVQRVQRETGIALQVISAREEAELAVLGCHMLLADGDGPALIFDIGGGSTELVIVEQRDEGPPRILDWESVPWGVVSLTEAEPHDSIDAAQRQVAYEAMRRRVRDAVQVFAARANHHRPTTARLLGTSGTVTTLASVHLALDSYDRSRIDGLHVPSADMVAVCNRLADMPVASRAAFPCIGRERADLVVAGCAILEEIIAIWPATGLSVADRGIREGILRLLMRAGPASHYRGKS